MNRLKVEIYGESHAEKIGVKISGLPIGAKIDRGAIEDMLARRRASNTPWSTPRKEKDEVVFLSGIDGETITGEVDAVIFNENVKANDYENIRTIPRPGHADYVSYVKYGKISSGGGKWSGRMTAPLCIAGAIAKTLLEKEGICLGAYISSIGNSRGSSYDDNAINYEEIKSCQNSELPSLSNKKEMIEEVLRAKANGDSVGGAIECVVYGLPVGLGDNLFDGMEGAISNCVFAVPGVKGIAFGLGFGFSNGLGSECNDAFGIKDGKVVTLTNNSGGINGGITNGMPLTLRVAMRPTPSILIEQDSVDLADMTPTKVSVKGRHDSCIVPRGVPAIESAVAIAVYDKYLEYKGN